MATTLGDAKIIVKLEFPGGKMPPGAPGTGANPNAPTGPPSSGGGNGGGAGGRRNPGDDGPDRDKDRADGGDDSFAWSQTKGYARGVLRGGLYDQVKNTAVAVPGVGLGVRVAEGIRDYGLVGTAALAEASKDLPDGIRQTVSIAMEAVTTIARDTAGSLTKFEVTLEAISATVDALREASVGAQALGGFDVGALPEFGFNLGRVGRFQALMSAAQRQRSAEQLGRAIGGMTGDGLSRLFAGASGR